MDKVKIGIVGTGYIGNVHGRIYARDARAEIAALFDIIPERMAETAKHIGGRICASREELLDHCDAVLVCAPNKTHPEIATAAVDAGKHVFCEKPFAIGIDEAAGLLAVAKSSGKVFQVGHSRRFAPLYVKLKELLSDDVPHSAHIKMNRGELLQPAWTGDTNVTGGFLYETTIHFLDQLRFQFGEIEELIAYGSQHEYPEIDEFSVIFRFRNGFHCTFASSADAGWMFPFERIEVFCHHRTIVAEEMVRLFDGQGTSADYATHSFHMLDDDARKGFAAEDAAFISSIVDGTPTAVTADDGYKAVELVEAVYESIRTGQSIRF
ncbi:MAG: Gfo/Idh/MocA family oxidoreductase [Chloracidobacterium sp.]|nr:Gfo/Idh/MocA family oxidoreductase [Chloracidobacterium sp.]